MITNRLYLLTCILLGLTSCLAQHAAPGYFVGTTPCDSLIRSHLQIPPAELCEFIKWELTLESDAQKFSLVATYGESQPNTNGFKGGGKKISYTGVYSIQPATTGNNAFTYTLQPVGSASSIFLKELDRNILHFTDGKFQLLVGNGGWGYVLNKTKKQ